MSEKREGGGGGGGRGGGGGGLLGRGMRTNPHLCGRMPTPAVAVNCRMLILISTLSACSLHLHLHLHAEESQLITSIPRCLCFGAACMSQGLVLCRGG